MDDPEASGLNITNQNQEDNMHDQANASDASDVPENVQSSRDWRSDDLRYLEAYYKAMMAYGGMYCKRWKR